MGGHVRTVRGGDREVSRNFPTSYSAVGVISFARIFCRAAAKVGESRSRSLNYCVNFAAVVVELFRQFCNSDR
jgi:hypothetical protein